MTSRLREPTSALTRPAAWLVLALLLTTACSGVRTDAERVRSYRLRDPSMTRAGQLFGGLAAERPGLSGVGMVAEGHVAFRTRIAMCDLAERTLDVQYYIWEPDMTGLLLAERLVQAAERGVRVRVLLDDINVRGRDQRIASLAGHPNIEVRAFNPFNDRGKFWDFATDFGRVNHRMHNKIMVVDNSGALLGGRNIADHYFGIDTDSNFRDLDVFAVGPVVDQVSRCFDDFWNAPTSVPFAAFVDGESTPAEAERAIAHLRVRMSDQPDYPYMLEGEVLDVLGHLEQRLEGLTWAPVRVLYDDPSKIYDGEAGVASVLRDEIAEASERLLIEAAYFVPGRSGVETAQRLEERGVEVRVLTNSMISNDVLAAHAGYAAYRQDLLDHGVELYEFRPDSIEKKKWSVFSDDSRASLHTKAVVMDDATFIGSFNLDPRSASINTEIGLLVWDRDFADQVAAFMDEGVRLDNSYQVRAPTGDMTWRCLEPDGVAEYSLDPHSTWWRRRLTGLIQLLPVEDQL